VMTLTAEHPVLIGRRENELLDSWIFAGDRGLIDCVWRAGVKRVSGGRHLERAALEARYARALKALLA
jgi:formimidoylglutamate deiminase